MLKVYFCESEWWNTFSDIFKEKYAQALVSGYDEARKSLTHLPKIINVIVDIAPWLCIPETGSGATTRNSRQILISLDHNLPFGEEHFIIDARSTMLHELNHANRYEAGYWHENFLDHCILEGLATVYEREQTGTTPPWGNYDVSLVSKWIQEIKENLETLNFQHYMYKHPDGRRWIGYLTGTYLVDQAIKKSGKDIHDLSNNSESQEILKLAEI